MAVNVQTDLQQLAVIKQALEEQLVRQPIPTPDQIDRYGQDIRKSLVECITMTQNDPGDRETLHGFVV
jgi:hypothetical protein